MVLSANAKKVLVWVIKILLGICLFAPLVVSSSFFFPYVVPRNLLFRCVVEIIFSLYLILALADASYRPKVNKMFWAVIAYFAILILSSFTGINTWKSWWGDFERMGGVWYLLHLLMYFVALVGIIKTEKDWRQLLWVSLSASIIMAFVGLGQQFGWSFVLKSSGGSRLTAQTGNAIYLAGYLLLHLFIIAYLIFTNKKNNSLINPLNICLAILGATEFYVLWQTQTRGAIIGLLMGSLLLLAVNTFKNSSKKVRLISGSCLAAIIILPLLVFLAKDTLVVKSSNTLGKLAGISLKDITTQSRLLTWQASWQGMLERPILGYGPENYSYVFNKRFPVQIYRDAGSQIWFDRSHNIIFDTGVAAGFSGLIAYLAIYFFAAYYLIRRWRSEGDSSKSWFWLAFLLAFFFQDFFVFDQLNTDVVFYLVLAGVVFLANGQPLKIKEASEKGRSLSLGAILAIIIVFLIVNNLVNLKPYHSNQDIVKAYAYKNGGKISSRTLASFRNAIAYNTTGKFEARQQFASYILDLVGSGQETKENLTPLVQEAENELKKSVAEEPLNARNQLFLANFYNSTAEFGDSSRIQNSISLLKQAIELSPTRPQIYFELGQSYFYLQQVDLGLEAFTKAKNLAPWVLDTHWNLLVAQIITGKSEMADREYQEIIRAGFNLADDPSYLRRLVSVYGRIKDWPKTIELSQALINSGMATVNDYLNLATAYFGNQQKDLAQKIVNQIKEKFPGYSSQADKVLQTNPTNTK